MRAKIIFTLAALLGSAFAAEIPRKSPDFVIQLAGKQTKVSDYRGKVLCLVFILTT
jgi:hypothetical protein